jgi:hypothetical protein
MIHCRYVYISIHVQSDGFVPDFFFNGTIVRTSGYDFLFRETSMKLPYPCLLSTVTESQSTLLATTSVQDLLKPVAQEAPEVWNAIFDSHEKKSRYAFITVTLIYFALYNRRLIKLDKL